MNSSALPPLPLTSFERFMLADDTPKLPLTALTDSRFIGELRRDWFTPAFEVALQRHPLLTATVSANDGRPGMWIPGTVRPPLDWQADDVPIESAAGFPIDMAHESGARFWVRVGHGQSRIVFQLHHACCDGAGMLRFFDDLMSAYVNLAAGNDPRAGLLPLNPDLLGERGGRALGGGLGQATWQRRWFELREGVRFHTRRPAPLATASLAPASSAKATPPARRDVPRADLFTVHMHHFSRAESTQLLDHAHRLGGNWNDLVTARWIETLDAWNRRHVGRSQRIRLTIATDLRGRGDWAMPAANVVGFAFIDRGANEHVSSAEHVLRVQQELAAIRRESLGRGFLWNLEYVARMPWLMRRLLRMPLCHATAVISNLGDASRRLFRQLPVDDGRFVFGNVIGEVFTFSPPVRPLTRAALATGRYAGRFFLTLRADPWRYTADESRALLDLLIERLLANEANAE